VTINHFSFVPVTIGLAFLTALLQTTRWQLRHGGDRDVFTRSARLALAVLVPAISSRRGDDAAHAARYGRIVLAQPGPAVLNAGGRATMSSTFPPIAEYGLLSNCEQSCLVAPNGAVEWLCLPRPDSPSVFGALLDRGAGTFRFGPSNAQVPQQRRYVPGTMVLETTWQTPTGWMTVQDFLAVGPVEAEERRADYHRAPTDVSAVGALVRIATCISGRVEVMVNCAPLFGYGTASGTWSYHGKRGTRP
jgi:hypothetical protein